MAAALEMYGAAVFSINKGNNMKKIITLALVLAMSSAWATGRDNDDQEQQQDQDQTQGQEQIVDVDIQIGGGGEGGAGTLASGGSASAQGGQGGNVEINTPAQGDYEVRFNQNPNVRPPSIQPTVNCYKTGGGGASGGGIGLSFGGGKIDPYCVEREEIRLAHEIGMRFQAAWRWCNMENNVRIFGTATDCLTANTSELSGQYHAILRERNQLRDRLAETERVLLQRCQEAEEATDRATDAWLECQAGK